MAADVRTQEGGVPVRALMRRAGTAVGRVALGVLGSGAAGEGRRSGRKVVALAGKGHNGGDALVALAWLARNGQGVEALLTADESDLDEEGRGFVAEVRAAGGRVRRFEGGSARRVLASADLVIDGLLGLGASGAPRGQVADAIRAANQGPAPVVAVDVASGVDAATGAVEGEAVRAAVTVTIQAAKPGHVLPPGREYTGDLAVADIGMAVATRWGLSEPRDLAGLLPLPATETNKYERGVLLLVAGAVGMAGAAVLAARAARRAGTGLLVVAGPSPVVEHIGSVVPEALTSELPTQEGGITPEAVKLLERWLERADALAIGPGMGRTQPTQDAVLGLLEEARMPAVVDADGLFAVGTGEPLERREAPTLVTPHEGEFARMAPGLEGTRLRRAAAAASTWGVTVLLKGSGTVIAEPEGRLVVNRTGTPVLATGGTGDVLTGMTGSLLAQGLTPFDAARLGAWTHGCAGRLAERELSPISVAAGDVAEHLPGAFTELRRMGGEA
jgi:ADP-dependent NAD(P)H-hydrate dehydratase / NAD(P)H-hydrate epimerase